MENRNRNNENAFVEFFKGLDENYQRYCIDQLQSKIKKPHDSRPNTKQADSAGLVGGPVSP